MTWLRRNNHWWGWNEETELAHLFVIPSTNGHFTERNFEIEVISLSHIKPTIFCTKMYRPLHTIQINAGGDTTRRISCIHLPCELGLGLVASQQPLVDLSLHFVALHRAFLRRTHVLSSKSNTSPMEAVIPLPTYWFRWPFFILVAALYTTPSLPCKLTKRNGRHLWNSKQRAEILGPKTPAGLTDSPWSTAHRVLTFALFHSFPSQLEHCGLSLHPMLHRSWNEILWSYVSV